MENRTSTGVWKLGHCKACVHDQYTELKTIWIDLSDPANGDTFA